MYELQTTVCYLEAGSSGTQEWLWAFTHENADKSLHLAAKRLQEKAINHRARGDKAGKYCAGDTIE
jgi:hypothetical protein